MNSPVGLVSSISRLSSCTPVKSTSDLYFDSSFNTVTSESALYKLLTSHILISSLIQRIRQSLRPSIYFYNNLIFYSERLLAPRPTPKLKDHSMTSVRGCLFPSTIRKTQDAPCCISIPSRSLSAHQSSIILPFDAI
jgi:hypothetical protein